MIELVCAECRKRQRATEGENGTKRCISTCVACGVDIEKGRAAKLVEFYTRRRIREPDGQVRHLREFAGLLYSEALASDGKRFSQMKENRILDVLVDSQETVEELFRWYVDRLNGQPKTARIEIALRHFADMAGQKQVGQLAREDLDLYEQMRFEQGIAQATFQKELGYIQAALTEAFYHDKASPRVLKLFKRRRLLCPWVDGQHVPEVTAEEAKRLLDTGHYLSPLIIAGLCTGARLGELLQAKRSHLQGDLLVLPPETTKDRKERRIPISPWLAGTLRQLPHALHHDHFFTLPTGDPIKSHNRAMRRIFEEAGIPYGRGEGGKTFRSLRPFAISGMDAAGVRDTVRRDLAGHGQLGRDRNYVRITDEERRQGMELYSAWLAGTLATEEGARHERAPEETLQRV